jgi:small subunit ribosomal protein S20
MPQHKSAIKRMRQNAKRRKQNREQRSRMRTLINRVLSEEDRDTAGERLKTAVSYLDKMSARGVIHKNKAARKKAQLTDHVNQL